MVPRRGGRAAGMEDVINEAAGGAPGDASSARGGTVASTEFYDVLGLDPSCSESEIKRAYYLAARRLHPDKNPDDPDAGAKFRHKGGLELAAYAVDEAGVYFGGTECAKSLGRLEAPGGARGARAAADVAAALSATGKGLYEQSPAATGAGLGAVAGTCEALADAFDDVPELRAATAQLRTGADRLRAGGAVLAGDPEQPKKKKPRRW
mgnify:CR=1 FL=1